MILTTPTASTEPEILSVSELTRLIKQDLEGTFPALWVRGEVSNFAHHRSGHMYFSLKDEAAVVRCVMFRQYNRYLREVPADGQQVLVRGKLTVYERGGQYQILVVHLQSVGVGLLAARFEELKERLRREGLFEPGRKRVLPSFVTTVGVVSSPDGAAIRDIVRVATKRFPGIRVILSPSAVQGEGASDQLVRALHRLVDDGRAQVIIVSRGGGSLEDLWPFNEEGVARAVAVCPIPVVSAVGHEIDFTISDFVADVRAPTPSAAAEMVVPDASALVGTIATLRHRLRRGMGDRVRLLGEQLRRSARAYGLRRAGDIVLARQQRLDLVTLRLQRNLAALLHQAREQLEGVRKQLVALSPLCVLQRGYSVARLLPAMDVVTDVAQVREGDLLDLLLAKGAAVCGVKERRVGEK